MAFGMGYECVFCGYRSNCNRFGYFHLGKSPKTNELKILNLKSGIINFIRGWLPQDPILHTHALPNQKKTGRVRVVFLTLAIGFLVIFGLLSALILIDSWIKLLLVGSILVGGLVWRFSRGNVKKACKFFVVAVLIFSISFTAVEFNLIWNAGYPPTYTSAQPGITISRANILNASLIQIVQNIERTPTYEFLTAQFGATTAETIKLDTSFPAGLVQVDFYGNNSDAYFYFSSSSGNTYHVNVGSSRTTYTTRFHPQAQPAQDSFAQIDALGLQWFYDRALDIAQNRTGSVLKIDALSFTMTFEGQGYIGYDRTYVSYEGITVQLIGSLDGESTLIADFEPNGTLIYMSQPQ